jgi:uncharacterized protein
VTDFATHGALAALCGGGVGFSLGLVGGGGSILAVPLLMYVVGIRDPHVAIGTSALAVGVNAFANLASHWRAGTVKWRCAGVFAATGVVGATVGSSLGKLMDGRRLLFLFALAMLVVAAAMLRRRSGAGDAHVRLTARIAARLGVTGLLVGSLSGFFGIGGGFLIVPGLMFGSGMPILNAIGSSLLSVGAFGLTTAINYAVSGLIQWSIALPFILGGVVGGLLGLRAALRLARERRMLTYLFAALVAGVAIYMLVRGAPH